MLKRSILCAILLLAFCSMANAQDFDVTAHKADPKTFKFDNSEQTVNGYIYSVLKEGHKCCGKDALYLEVKFDQEGKVIAAKTLTGKDECYKKAVVEIVKTVIWESEGVKATKTIYFELKPELTCKSN